MKKKKGKAKAENTVKKGRKASRHLGLKISLLTGVILLTALVCAYRYIDKNYTIHTVYVEGNSHYTNEEIIEKVMKGRLGHNSIYLNFRYRNQEIEDIPFVSAMEVEIITPDTVRITVYEKSLAGYVTYLGRYMYFDKDGVVVESSEASSADVPEVVGLSFDHVVMYEKLPVEKEDVFAEILDITQSLKKYELRADKLFFDKEYRITLYFGNVRVEIGDTAGIEEKFSRLRSILPELEGKSGVLQMENFSPDSKIVPFQADKK